MDYRKIRSVALMDDVVVVLALERGGGKRVGGGGTRTYTSVTPSKCCEADDWIFELNAWSMRNHVQRS